MNSYSCRVASLSSLLKLVGEESRLKILCILKQGQHCVCEIEKDLNQSQSLISHHLSDLKEAGLVIDEKKGLWSHYSLTEKGRKIIGLIFQIKQL